MLRNAALMTHSLKVIINTPRHSSKAIGNIWPMLPHLSSLRNQTHLLHLQPSLQSCFLPRRSVCLLLFHSLPGLLSFPDALYFFIFPISCLFQAPSLHLIKFSNLCSLTFLFPQGALHFSLFKQGKWSEYLER